MLNLILISFTIIFALEQNVFSKNKNSLIIRFGSDKTQVLDTTLLKNELEKQLSRTFEIQFQKNLPQEDQKVNFNAKVNASLNFEKNLQSSEFNSIQAESKGNSNLNLSPSHDIKENQTSGTKISKESKATLKVDIAIPQIHSIEELSKISNAFGVETFINPDSNTTLDTYPKKIFKNLNLSIEESKSITSTGASYLLIINDFRSVEKVDLTKTKFFQGTRNHRISELDFTFASISADRILRKDKISATRTTLSGKLETSLGNIEKTNQTLVALVKKLAKSITENLEPPAPTEKAP
jgi:hypothetical protein